MRHIKTNERRIKSPRTCWYCQEEIPTGTLCLAWTFKVTTKFYNYWTHNECHNKAKESGTPIHKSFGKISKWNHGT